MKTETRDTSIPQPETGAPVHGRVRIDGTKRKDIKIFYDGRSHTDTFDYRPAQDGYMMAMTHQLLWEMVTGKGPEQPTGRPVGPGVRPRKGGR